MGSIDDMLYMISQFSIIVHVFIIVGEACSKGQETCTDGPALSPLQTATIGEKLQFK